MAIGDLVRALVTLAQTGEERAQVRATLATTTSPDATGDLVQDLRSVSQLNPWEQWLASRG